MEAPPRPAALEEPEAWSRDNRAAKLVMRALRGRGALVGLLILLDDGSIQERMPRRHHPAAQASAERADERANRDDAIVAHHGARAAVGAVEGARQVEGVVAGVVVGAINETVGEVEEVCLHRTSGNDAKREKQEQRWLKGTGRADRCARSSKGDRRSLE